MVITIKKDIPPGNNCCCDMYSHSKYHVVPCKFMYKININNSKEWVCQAYMTQLNHVESNDKILFGRIEKCQQCLKLTQNTTSRWKPRHV